MHIDRSIKAAILAHQEARVSIDEINSSVEQEHQPSSWSKRERKTYPRLEYLKLERPEPLSASLHDALMNRRSTRCFKATGIPLIQLASLLSSAIRERPEQQSGIRPYASAGARYPCELYIATGNVSELGVGLFHYDAIGHGLTRLLDGDALSQVKRNTLLQESGEPAFVVVITGALHRSMPKYGGRGYRYALIEAGEIAQSLSLVGAALGLGSCLIGGFDDSAISECLDVSWELEVEAPILLVPFGMPDE